ncbi:glycoside hydrolase family 5 protein [Atractiella rhizophila]|nr:glycoside hydrolase family 5 protein [Atractiella rhizophila]
MSFGASAVPSRSRALGNNGGKSRKWLWIAIGILVVAAAVAIPVGIVVSNKNKDDNKSSNSSDPSSPTQSGTSTLSKNPSTKSGKWSGNGGDGEVMIMDDGTTFVYQNNNPGSTWDAVPFSMTARAQGDVPALNEDWDYGSTRIFGVNLGGWMVIEPFIAPNLFEPYLNDASPAVDEWTLCEKLGDSMAETIENHYKTFITEKDIAAIASAGLNWVRLPVGWWNIETWQGEPFLAGVGWKYVLKVLEWCRKYGIRVNLDLHAVPGSQNGYNHSGRLGTINFLMGVMGVANAQRSLNYIRTLTEFIAQPEYSKLIPMFSVLNEPRYPEIGALQMRQFYHETYQTIRGISGYGKDNGPAIVLHDGFDGQAPWYGWMQGADRIFLDTHSYLCFDAANVNANDTLANDAKKPCQWWAPSYNRTYTNFNFVIAGEFSLAVNDCGEFINNVGAGTRYEATLAATTGQSVRQGSCDPWNDYTKWDDDFKAQLKNVAAAHMDAFQSFFFWNWKIGNSTQTGIQANPMWSYSLGLEQGYIAANPRENVGFCVSYMASTGSTFEQVSWAGSFSDWQTGGAGTTSYPIVGYASANYTAWPPASLTSYPNANFLPTYTPTGSVITLSASTPTAAPKGATTNPGDGWLNPSDTAGWYVQNPACSYLDPWGAHSAEAPVSSACGGGAAKRMVKRAPMPVPTSPPEM